MTTCQAKLVPIDCPHCKAQFEVMSWVIVDVWERPDLTQLLQRGVLHLHRCPQCGRAVSVDTPLLVYRSYEKIPFTISMPSDTTRAQATKYGASLLAELRQALGSDWDEAWLRNRYKTVDRTELRVLMNLDLALIGRDKLATEAAEQMLADGSAPAEHVALWSLLNAATWADAAAVVQAHPEMLTTERIVLLDEMAKHTEQEMDNASATVLRLHQKFLECCAEVGVDAALDDYRDAPKGGQ